MTKEWEEYDSWKENPIEGVNEYYIKIRFSSIEQSLEFAKKHLRTR